MDRSKYTQKAKHKNAKGIIVTSVTLTCAIASAVMASRLGLPILHSAAAVLFILGASLAARFVFTEYEYTVDDGIFTVTETRAKRKRVSVRVYLTEIDEVLSVKRRKDAKRKAEGYKKYDYRPDLSPRAYHILILRSENFCAEGEEVRILIQPDERMADILEKAASSRK